MKKILITALICLLIYSSKSQNKYSDSLKTVLSGAVKPMERFDLMNKIMEYAYISGGTNADSAYCIELLDIAHQTDNDSLLAVAYNQVGNYFFRYTNDFSRGLEYFFKGIPLAEKVDDKRRLSSLYIDIAAVYDKLNNRAEEIKYIRKAFEELPEKTSPLYPFMVAQAQYYLGGYFLSQNQNDSALYYSQALAVTNLSLKSPLYDAAINGLMGAVYEKTGEKALAEVHYYRANSKNDSINYLFGKIVGKKMFIDYLLRNNKSAEAKVQALALMDIGNQNQLYDAKMIAAGSLTIVYDHARQPDSAFYYSRLESAMKDSLFNQDKINRIQSLAFDEHIRVMEEQERLATEAEQRKQNIQFALLALGIISFVILFLLLSRRHITNAKVIQFLGVVALLVVFEFLNLLLTPFLERITHHAPFLMLLALVCIAALLTPLHHHLEKWATQKLVEKNKQARLRVAKKTIEQLEKNSP